MKLSRQQIDNGKLKMSRVGMRLTRGIRDVLRRENGANTAYLLKIQQKAFCEIVSRGHQRAMFAQHVYPMGTVDG